MAIKSLQKQKLKDSYQFVVQTDGVNLADGRGRPLPITIDNEGGHYTGITISGSLTGPPSWKGCLNIKLRLSNPTCPEKVPPPAVV